MQYDDAITNPRWRTDAILKIVFWLYLGAILTDQCEIWNDNYPISIKFGRQMYISIPIIDF